MAGTITLSHQEIGHIRKITATCTGDAADGSYPDTALPSFEGRLLQLKTNPGATAPTANYDITLVDANGIDVLQSAGLNRHTTNSEVAAIIFASSSVHPYVDATDVLTLNIDANIVNSAGIVIELYYAPGA